MTATKTSPPASPPEGAPGFVDRGPRFEEYVSRAASWRWRPGETLTRLLLAIPAGARDLSPSELKMLLIYVSHLNWDAIEQENDACVWPSTGLVYDLAGFSEATGRRLRKSLEAKGYLIRWFNRINRPKGEEAVDLAILLSRRGELEGSEDAVREAHRERRAAQRASLDLEREGGGGQDRSVMGAQVLTDEPLEQTQEKISFSVRGAGAPAARSRSKAPVARGAPGRAVGSIGARAIEEHLRAGLAGVRAPREGARVSVSGPFPASVRAEMALQELQLAVQVSPRMAALVPPNVLENPATASLADAENWARAAGDLLPDPKRNNADTFRWAWRAHGVRALAMLALAIEDKVVEKPANWFGGMAKADPERLDLRPNFARMLRERGEFPREVAPASAAGERPPAKKPLADPERFFDAPPGAEDPTWLEISAEFRSRLHRAAEWDAWFREVGFRGIEGERLMLTAPGPSTAAEVKNRYGDQLRRAATDAGWPVKFVIVTPIGRGRR